jgi:hypothetical protein
MPERQTVTFVHVNPPSIRQKLVSQMAICTQTERTYRHQLYDVINPVSHVLTGSIGLETEPSRISLVYKPTASAAAKAADPADAPAHAEADAKKPFKSDTSQLSDGLNADGEIVLGVSDFDLASALLRNMGMHPRTFQEVKREIWEHSGVTIGIESWPWIDPFVIIGAESRARIDETAAMLGLTSDLIYESDVPNLYRDAYGIDETMFFNTPKLMFLVRPSWVQAFKDKVDDQIGLSEARDAEAAAAAAQPTEGQPAAGQPGQSAQPTGQPATAQPADQVPAETPAQPADSPAEQQDASAPNNPAAEAPSDTKTEQA